MKNSAPTVATRGPPGRRLLILEGAADASVARTATRVATEKMFFMIFRDVCECGLIDLNIVEKM